MNFLADRLYNLAEKIDLAISDHVRTPGNPCRWYCEPGAKLADVLRSMGNKIWRSK